MIYYYHSSSNYSLLRENFLTLVSVPAQANLYLDFMNTDLCPEPSWWTEEEQPSDHPSEEEKEDFLVTPEPGEIESEVDNNLSVAGMRPSEKTLNRYVKKV